MNRSLCFGFSLLLLLACSEAPRSARTEKTPLTAPVVAAKVLPAWSPVHQFYGVYMKGQKVGWAEETIALDSDGLVKFAQQITMKIGRAGAVMTLDWSETTWFEAVPGGQLVKSRVNESLGTAGRVQYEGERQGNQFQIRTVVDGNEQVNKVPIPKRRVEEVIPSLWIQRMLAAKPDESVIAHQFNYKTRQDEVMESSIVSRSKTRLHGVPVTILEIKTVLPSDNLTMVGRGTEDGQMLEMQVGPMFRMLLEDKAVAQDISAATPDMFASAMIQLNTPLGSAPVRSLTLKVSGVPEDAIPSDGRQWVDGSVVQVFQRTHGDTPTSELSEEKRSKYLESSAFIDHQNHAIRALADRAKSVDSPLKRVKRINALVFRALRYTLETAPESASAILAMGRGDCSEYARLAVAVLRASGFPAREVSGIAYLGDASPGLGYHAWVEVYLDGRWFPMDPTWNQVPIDASHVTLSRGSSTSFAGLVGSMKATVQSINGRVIP